MASSPTTPPAQVDTNSAEYLTQLLKDKKQISAFPNVFLHLERLLDAEISRVRGQMFYTDKEKSPLDLPEASGPKVTLQEKVFVPVKEHPDFNFVGRILGPRGMTAKQLEQDTGCKIMVRGKGSMRDKKKEDQNRGKPNWEHLNEDLHVLITVEDSRGRAEKRLARAVDEVRKLLQPSPDGEDDLKKRQLMELAIINGTYRDHSAIRRMANVAALSIALPTSPFLHIPSASPMLYSPSLTSPSTPSWSTSGVPLTPQQTAQQILNATQQQQQQQQQAAAAAVNGAASGLIYSSYDFGNAAAAAAGAALAPHPATPQQPTTPPSPVFRYPSVIDQTGMNLINKVCVGKTYM